MSAKFTPGPWHIDEGATTRFIIAVGNDKTGHGWSEIATARDFENARLIAAAPDMYAAICGFLEAGKATGGIAGLAVTARLAAAIAKAEGQL